MQNNQDILLGSNISDLQLPEELKSLFIANGFLQLHQVTSLHISEVLKIPGFNYHMLQEYVQFLQDNGLGNKISQH